MVKGFVGSWLYCIGYRLRGECARESGVEESSNTSRGGASACLVAGVDHGLHGGQGDATACCGGCGCGAHSLDIALLHGGVDKNREGRV